MQSRWNDTEAAAFVARHREHGEALALRVYSSRLIGSDPDLVLHGGGNTSVKTTARDVLGREIQVLHVKGSGSDLASVEPAGLPAVALAPLLQLRALPKLGDAAMVNAVRGSLLDSSAPNPSVETLLHAFLPHVFVDHTHADAILALTDQPDGERLAREALGPEVPILPWIMPGFPLAKAVADAYERAPHCTAIVLLKHGVFTFGSTAKESYERMIEVVDRAERFLAARIGPVPALLRGAPAPLPVADREAFLARALPCLRGALVLSIARQDGVHDLRAIAAVRAADDLAAFAAHPDAPQLCERGPITPDHALRTKGCYLFVHRKEATDPVAARAAVGRYVERYQSYHAAHAPAFGNPSMLVPTPAVVVIEGCGLAGFMPSVKAARICADLAEHTVRTIARAEALGRYAPLAPADLFEMEYWPLERAKLGASRPLPLAGQVALVTGAAGAIGCGIAEVLLEQGACVCLSDVDAARLAAVARRLHQHAGALSTVVADLTDAVQVERAFAACCLRFGGVDCVVPNAGIAHVSPLETMDPARFRAVQDVNVTGTMLVLQAAARVFRAQQTGGSVVLQASKNAFAPGAGFGAYSASKAAALQLGRIAALEFAEFGVTVNMVNADAVFGDDEVPSQLWQTVGPDRMRARGLDAKGLREFYRERSLLKVTVTPRHVGEAVAFFAAGRTPTTGAVLPVDGGLPEAFPR